MTASNVAIISAAIAFTGLMVTLITKLMNVSVKYGELVKQIDMVQNMSKAACKDNADDIGKIDKRLVEVERKQLDTAIMVARIDENVQQLTQLNAKLDTKIDNLCNQIAQK